MSEGVERMCIGGPHDGTMKATDTKAQTLEVWGIEKTEEARGRTKSESEAARIAGIEVRSLYKIAHVVESDGTCVEIWLHESIEQRYLFRHILTNYRPKAEASG